MRYSALLSRFISRLSFCYDHLLMIFLPLIAGTLLIIGSIRGSITDDLLPFWISTLGVVCLPLVGLMLGFIRGSRDEGDRFGASLPLISALIIVMIWTTFSIHPLLVSAIILLLMGAALLSLIDARQLFLVALMGLILTVVALLWDRAPLAEQASITVYYALVAGVVAELLAPPLRSLIQRYRWMQYSPTFEPSDGITLAETIKVLYNVNK